MAYWLDQLQPASFKGVPFQVDSIDVSAGDNVIVREYPFQDLPTVFRMGAATEEIKFSAYVIGDDYIDQREALRDALTGQGILVHPTAGAMRVAVAGKFRIQEAPTAEGGMARFDLVFVRAEPRRYPASVSSTSETALSAAGSAQAAAVDDFANRFSLTGLPGWVSDQVVGRLGATLDTAWSGIKVASAGLNDFSNDMIGSYQVLRSGMNDLVNTPRELGNQINLLFSLPDDLSKEASAGFQNAFTGLFDVGRRVPDTSFRQKVIPSAPGPSNPVMAGFGNPQALTLQSAARAALADQVSCINHLVGTLAVSAFVAVLAQTDLDSYDQALKLRKKVYDQCTSLLFDMSDQAAPALLPSSALHDAVIGLLSACLADLQGRTFSAARMMTWTPDRWMPIWVASYQLYGTTAWADEIMAMNPHISHPLLVPPGKPLTVIRHG